VWVSGELSDVAFPPSGHVYFTLKDDAAQIRGVIWRSAMERIRFELQDGLQVVCQGEVDVYPPRGGYQLIVSTMHPLGEGALQLALRQLRQRLADEGLFDPRHKKPLPRFPRRVAVVTSPTGAAIRDFIEVLRRRWKGIEVLIVPTRVQGPGAAGEIVRAIQLANRIRPAPEVIVVTRGGGSLEDLWCFNEEPVVRAIFASRCPVMSAVGHEIDVTLTDLVADVRALTPSEAAERLVPSQQDLQSHLRSFQQRLVSSLRGRAASIRRLLDSLAQRPSLRRPLDPIHQAARRVDELQGRAARAAGERLGQARSSVQQLAGKLESLSPLSVLRRGYSVTQITDDATLVTAADHLVAGQRITTIFARGTAVSRVEQTDSTPSAPADGGPPEV
jgi:exodeoxyribonuclease VII large subunit